MSTFNTTRFISTKLSDLSGVSAIVKQHFESQGYMVDAVESSYGCFISITKGGVFKSVLGMKSSLNVDVKKVSGGVSVNAKVGIFGQELVEHTFEYQRILIDLGIRPHLIGNDLCLLRMALPILHIGMDSRPVNKRVRTPHCIE